jgi:membrane protein DedA with SNARE-associated domain
LDPSITAILHFAAHQPMRQALAVIFATFILEDAATVIAAMEAQSGALSVPLGLASLYSGIVLGDIGLYGLGRLAGMVPLVQRLLPPRRTEVVRAWLSGKIFRVVLISRFLPGVRLPTYTTCGYLRADLGRFTLAAVLATMVWTSGLFALSFHVGKLLMAHFGAWRWAGAAGIIAFMLIAGRVVQALRRPRRVVADPSPP